MSTRSILTDGTCGHRHKSRTKHVTFNPISTSYGAVEYLSDTIPPPPPDPQTVEPTPYVDTWEMREYFVRLKFSRKKRQPSAPQSGDGASCDNADDNGDSNYSSGDDHQAQPPPHGPKAPPSPELTAEQQLEHDWHYRGSPAPGVRMKELGKKGRKEREGVVRRCHYAWQMERRRLHEMQQEWERLGKEKDALEKRVKEGLGRAEWELAIIQRRKMRELETEMDVRTEARLSAQAEVLTPLRDEGDDPNRDSTMVDVEAQAANMDAAAVDGSLDDLQRQYAEVLKERKALDVRSTNQPGMVARQMRTIRDDLVCEGLERKRKRADSEYCGR